MSFRTSIIHIVVQHWLYSIGCSFCSPSKNIEKGNKRQRMIYKENMTGIMNTFTEHINHHRNLNESLHAELVYPKVKGLRVDFVMYTHIHMNKCLIYAWDNYSINFIIQCTDYIINFMLKFENNYIDMYEFVHICSFRNLSFSVSSLLFNGIIRLFCVYLMSFQYINIYNIKYSEINNICLIM